MKWTRWQDVGERAYIDRVTQEIGYHYAAGGAWQDTAGCVVGSRAFPWLADFKTRRGDWHYVGCFRTAREARRAAVDAHTAHWRDAALRTRAKKRGRGT